MKPYCVYHYYSSEIYCSHNIDQTASVFHWQYAVLESLATCQGIRKNDSSTILGSKHVAVLPSEPLWKHINTRWRDTRGTQNDGQLSRPCTHHTPKLPKEALTSRLICKTKRVHTAGRDCPKIPASAGWASLDTRSCNCSAKRRKSELYCVKLILRMSSATQFKRSI